MDFNAISEKEPGPRMVWKPPVIPTVGLWAYIIARLWLPAPSISISRKGGQLEGPMCVTGASVSANKHHSGKHIVASTHGCPRCLLGSYWDISAQVEVLSSFRSVASNFPGSCPSETSGRLPLSRCTSACAARE